jgi:hypothetical protein
MESAAEMRQALSAEIPVGTSVNDAVARLRKRGFEVSSQTDASFAENGAVRNHLDYLYGAMSERIGLFASRQWQVAVVHQDGAVTEILVRVDLAAL